MKISVNSLRKMNACEPGIDLFEKTYGNKEIDAIKALLKFAKLEPKYSIWWLSETFSKEQNIRLAIFSAELVLHIFENKYPDDNRPRKAIEAAKEYLKNPQEENRKAAYSAYASASATASASYAASSASASSASASYASATASYAAAAATAAACAATASAYASADYEKAEGKTYLKIIKYGIKLLKEEEKK